MKEEKAEKEVRGIVRLAGRDVRGDMKLHRSLTKVKGVGLRLSRILSELIYSELKLPKDAVIGELSDEQLDKVEEMLANPKKYGVPGFLLNRQKELDSTGDVHRIATDLTFAVKQDIEMNKNMNTWKGFRHAYGQKVRGQHTRSTGRTGMTVGVLRKAVLAKAGAAAQAAQVQAQAGSAAPTAAAGAAEAPKAAEAKPAVKEQKPAAKEQKPPAKEQK